MKKYSTLFLAFIVFLFTQCTSKKSATVLLQAETAFSPEPNTVYKEFPNGERFITNKKEYFPNGKLATEYQWVARPEKAGDSSYYFHALARKFTYLYDSQGRLTEKLEYMNTGDTIALLYQDLFQFMGDSMVHERKAYDHLNGELMFTKLKAKQWYKDGRLIKRFTPDGYRDDHTIEEWEYGDDGVLRKYIFDNMTNDDVWYGGERIPYYAKKIIFYDSQAKPVSDSIYNKGEDGKIHTWVANYYDSYGSINRSESTPSIDAWAENPKPDINARYGGEIKPNPLRGEAKDPSELVNYLLTEGKTEMRDFQFSKEFIYLRKIDIQEGKVVAIYDSIKPEERNGNLIGKEQFFSYNSEGRLIKTVYYIKMQGFDKKRIMETYDYHPNGTVKTKSQSEKYDHGRGYTLGFFEDGSREYYAQSTPWVTDYPDSIVTYYDPIRGTEIGEAKYMNDTLVGGIKDFYDENGKLVREYNEKEYKDVLHFYTPSGRLSKSEFYYVKYYGYNRPPFNRWLEYILLYGDGVF